MKKISLVFLVVGMLMFFSCEDSRGIKPEIAQLDLEINFIRFDSIFAEAQPEDLNKLKDNYPFMFENSIPDSLWYIKMKDALQNEIEQEVLKAFSDFSIYQNEITLFFKHLKFYFPKIPIPKVVTLSEYVDYKSKVGLNKDLLYISLDNYLGQEHKFYSGFQTHISDLQIPEQILPDIANQYAKKLIAFPDSRSFLSQMIYEGKKLYFKSQLLPWVEEHQLIGYSKDDYHWAQSQEFMTWKFFVEKDMLYSSQSDLRRRFLNSGPFTKFYLEFDNETPPRLGQYMGWQIVNAFAKRHPDKSLREVLEMSEQDLFNQSKYKP